MGVGPTAPMSANLNMNSAATPTVNETRDGWDNEDWGSLEEEPANEELEEKATNEMNHISASRSNSNSHSHSSSMGIYNNNITNNVSPTKNNGDDSLTKLDSSANNSNWDNYGSSWNDDDFEPLEETGARKLA
jgi:SCY1-like protein 1